MTPTPSPFLLEGGPVGLLLLHGFTGSPPELRPMADYLHQRGLTISAPLLPGHGTSLDELDQVSWKEWTAYADAAVDELGSRCEQIFVAGLSMGALIALYLASHRSDLRGVISYAAPFDVGDWRTRLLPLLKFLIRRWPHPEPSYADPETAARLWFYEAYSTPAAHEVTKLIREVRGKLAAIEAPLLVVHANQDARALTAGSETLYREAGSAVKEKLVLTRSGHIITADAEWPLAAEHTLKFIQKHSRGGEVGDDQ